MKLSKGTLIEVDDGRWVKTLTTVDVDECSATFESGDFITHLVDNGLVEVTHEGNK